MVTKLQIKPELVQIAHRGATIRVAFQEYYLEVIYNFIFGDQSHEPTKICNSASPRQIFNFFPNHPPPHHNLGQILNSDPASS